MWGCLSIDELSLAKKSQKKKGIFFPTPPLFRPKKMNERRNWLERDFNPNSPNYYLLSELQMNRLGPSSWSFPLRNPLVIGRIAKKNDELEIMRSKRWVLVLEHCQLTNWVIQTARDSSNYLLDKDGMGLGSQNFNTSLFLSFVLHYLIPDVSTVKSFQICLQNPGNVVWICLIRNCMIFFSPLT